MLLALALGLTACGGSTKYANPELSIKPVLKAPPVELQARCQDPVLLPEGGKTQVEVEGLWATDRANLIDCRDRKAAEQRYYQKRDAEISG